MKKQVLFTILMLLSMVANAYDAYIDGIYYYLDNTIKTAKVAPGYYDSSNQSVYYGTVTIPSSVNYYGESYTVTSIASFAFYNCSDLISVSIPNSITSIEPDAFEGSGWYNNQPDGLLYLDKWLIGHKGEELIGDIAIEEGTWGIADNAFAECCSLTSVTLPNSMTIIGQCAFSGCTGLTSITIPNSVTNIGKSAFSVCNGLTTVTIPNSLTEIEAGTFSYCESLISITIPNSVKCIKDGDYIGGHGMVEDYGGAFRGCSSLTFATIPNSVTSIGNGTFQGCSNLVSVTIPNSVTRIGKSTFADCSSLTSVTIPSTLTHIERNTFSYCTSLSSLTIPNNVISIDYWTFYGCTGLKSIEIPNSVTSIVDGTFGCTGLTSVVIPNSVTSIGGLAFSECRSLTSVTIPNSVTSIGGSAFSECSSLTSITIPNSVTSIGGLAFYRCYSLSSVHISDIASWCNISFGNDMANPLSYAHHLYLDEEEIKDIVIPSSVTSIGKYTFFGFSELTSVTISNNVTTIGESAFEGCYGMEILKLPDELHIIRKGAFKGCNGLKSVTIPASVEFIYQEAFANCDALESVKALPETPPFLYDNSFSSFSVPLKVPKGCKEAYQTAQGWKNFTNISDADKYKLTYVLDNEEYKCYDIEEGETITPEAAPTKDGYTFSGWSEIPATMPSHDVTVTGSFSINSYTITYVVDGAEYKTASIEYGTAITAEPIPTKEGYTFSGWSEIPATMPSHDVTVIGSFSINSYTLTYMVDGVEYKKASIEYGSSITAETAPTKEGYTFSGWSEIPATMPAHDVTVTGSYSINSYTLTYMVDGTEYKTISIEYGSSITAETAPTKEGYTFSGWSEIPATMPAHDVTVTGTFSINSYKVTFMYGDNVLTTIEVKYGDKIELPTSLNSERYTLIEWLNVPETMPAQDITIYADYVDGINDIAADSRDAQYIQLNGMYTTELKPGLNIIRMKDGTTKKVWVK